ncbi:MAG: helix-turn-helix domain-containing protein [Pseudonocardiaceae bacterium]
MTLAFRNIDASPTDPVESWPTEAVITALERGGLSDWHRLGQAVRADPWGPVARRIEEALTCIQPYGVDVAMQRILSDARTTRDQAERDAVAKEIAQIVRASGLSKSEFASRIGTSASRLSTYLSGSVTPSASLLLRMRAVSP